MMRIPGYRGLLGAVITILFAAALFAGPHRAEASSPDWKFELLYHFHNYCTAPCALNVPSSGVTIGPGGKLFGTTCDGGTESNAGGVYQLTPGREWQAKKLADFTVHDPFCPTAANLLLVESVPHPSLSEITFYGTTPGDYGMTSCGTVYELSRVGSRWEMTTIYTFQNDGDGCGPYSGLIQDAQGNLYGTTFYTSSLFELTNNGSGWTFNTLYDFEIDDPGAGPTGNLLLDKSGNLYGTTLFGGTQTCGEVFELLSDHKTYNVLHNFCTTPDDGYTPTGALIMDQAGNLYGVTNGGNGTVFKISAGDNFKTLYTFCRQPSCLDGANPLETSLLMDEAGNLYGNTCYGGYYTYGTVFEITTGGEEIVLHSFRGSDGAYPVAPLTFDADGNILGTTGSGSGGAVFKLTRRH